MSTFTLVSSICMRHSATLVYRSADGLIGLVVYSGGRKPDRRRYFVWDLPDSAPEYATEAEARAAQEDTPMPETPTPGQVAYAAYAKGMQPHHAMSLWGFLPPYCQEAWEAAAQAAIAQWWRDHEAVICGNDDEERDDATLCDLSG